MKKNDTIECSIESLAFGGRGVGRVDGRVLFVEGCVPGQTVKAKITKLSKRFAEAETVEVVTQSPDFSEPFCKHFGECGGCMHQNMTYAAQLREKQAQVTDAMQRIGRVEFETIDPIVPSPKERHYRNKMEFAFSGTGRGLALGLRNRGGKGIVNVTSCHLASEQCVAILNETREMCRESGIAAYSPKDRTGFWRHLVVRHSEASGECMVHLITASGRRNFEAARVLGEYLVATQDVDRFIHSTRKSNAELAFGEWEVEEIGGRRMEERLNIGGHSIRYAISPNAFFQPNSATAEVLGQTVLEYAGLTETSSVLDLYCGCGTLSLALAPHAAKVVGVELSKSAVEDAEYNAGLNDFSNCLFTAMDIEQETASLRRYASPDVLVTDPPRGGMRGDVVAAIKDLGPRRIVAVSCDPPALARDIAKLGYRAVRLRSVDQFPHTPHVECVALLEKP